MHFNIWLSGCMMVIQLKIPLIKVLMSLNFICCFPVTFSYYSARLSRSSCYFLRFFHFYLYMHREFFKYLSLHYLLLEFPTVLVLEFLMSPSTNAITNDITHPIHISSLIRSKFRINFLILAPTKN